MIKKWFLVKSLKLNSLGRDIVVGDIHGHFSRLAAQLQRIGFDKMRDRLISVGDLVDRGPESFEALRWLEQPWFHPVLGNHDLSVLASYQVHLGKIGARYHHLICDSHDWINDADQPTQQRLLNVLAQLPVAIEIETQEGLVGVVHAEVPQSTWKDFLSNLLGSDTQLDTIYAATWSRTMAWHSHDIDEGEETSDAFYQLEGVRHVIHGHTPARDLRIKRLSNRYFIDTGGWFPSLTPSDTRTPHFTLIDVRRPWQPL